MENKEKEKQHPEVAVARSYFNASHMVWQIQHNADSYGYSKETVDKMTEKYMPYLKAVKTQAQDRFVVPNQENKNDKNREAGFGDWYMGWSDLFYGMPQKTYEKFAELEKQYHETGWCPQFEQLQLPKKFKRPITDLTDKEWAEREKIKDAPTETKQLLGSLIAGLKNKPTATIKKATTIGDK